MRENKIYLFKDRKDYIKKITNDKIYNITGEKGSGKTYFGNIKDNNSKVIHLDNVYVPEGQIKKHDYSNKLRSELVKKLGDNLFDFSFENDVYPIIIKFIGKDAKEKYIEGGSIALIENIKNIKGTVVVKRTGILKSYLRAVKRDYANLYFMKIEVKKYGKFGKVTRLFKILKRRISIFGNYHKVEDFIKRLENYK